MVPVEARSGAHLGQRPGARRGSCRRPGRGCRRQGRSCRRPGRSCRRQGRSGRLWQATSRSGTASPCACACPAARRDTQPRCRVGPAGRTHLLPHAEAWAGSRCPWRGVLTTLPEGPPQLQPPVRKPRRSDCRGALPSELVVLQGGGRKAPAGPSPDGRLIEHRLH